MYKFLDKLNQDTFWRSAVIYQILPKSFFDTDADGKGDIKGIIAKLDYIKSLGVDAIWMTPLFDSTGEDIGYDVVNYTKIDESLGTMDDFKNLLEIAHNLDLKVLIDLVLNHTSDKHPWFIESSSYRDNSKADWYVWADPAEDGGVPNNWLSAFSGKTAWHWSEKREQYYLANFLESQPDLNWH